MTAGRSIFPRGYPGRSQDDGGALNIAVHDVQAHQLHAVPERRVIPNSLYLVRQWDQFLAAQGSSERTRHSYRYGVLRLLTESPPGGLRRHHRGPHRRLPGRDRGPEPREEPLPPRHPELLRLVPPSRAPAIEPGGRPAQAPEPAVPAGGLDDG